MRFFDDNGYLVLKDWITGDLLRRLQEAGRRWIAQGLHADPADPDLDDYRFADRPQGRTMWRVDYLHNKGQSASLELLGSPQVLGVVESLSGPNFTPTYEAMVFKQEGDGAAVQWHQDVIHARQYRDLQLRPLPGRITGRRRRPAGYPRDADAARRHLPAGRGIRVGPAGGHAG